MRRIKSFTLYALDLPFKKPFKHAAASRETSDSIFIKCTTDTGVIGFGECLPRSYVTGETRDSAFALLKNSILPKLIGKKFGAFAEVKQFLHSCDGKAPVDWLDPDQPQTAAWCAVDIALLDTFGYVFNESVWLDDNTTFPSSVRYSVVISSGAGYKTLLFIRLAAISQVKIKVEKENSATFIVPEKTRPRPSKRYFPGSVTYTSRISPPRAGIIISLPVKGPSILSRFFKP
jgi:muconate cycloisomerase